MKVKIAIVLSTILVTIFSGCTNNNPPNGFSESEYRLIMTTYKKGWIDGANAAVHAANSNEPFGGGQGTEKFKTDSLTFVGLLYSINH